MSFAERIEFGQTVEYYGTDNSHSTPSKQQSPRNSHSSLNYLTSTPPDPLRPRTTSTPSGRIKFDSYLQVVLIPTRQEFKRARCDLWWAKLDYLKFQQAAAHELRMLTILQNISVREAKRKLYQPEYSAEMDDKSLTGHLGGGHRTKSDESDVFDFSLSKRSSDDTDDEGEDSPSTTPPNSPMVARNSLDSEAEDVNMLHDLDDDYVEDADAEDDLDQLDQNVVIKRVFQSCSNLAQLASEFNHDISHNGSVDLDLVNVAEDATDTATEDDSILIERTISLYGRPQWRDDKHWNLQLNVPLAQTVKLNDTPNGPPPPARKNNNNHENHAVFTVMGIVSFALPLLGYYLFHAYQ